MKYLFVSGTLYDGAGLAMIQGAMNGIKTLDDDAVFCSLHRKIHDKKVDGCDSFMEPNDNLKAFKWADGILDVGGLCNCQKNKYEWLRLRKKFNKPYVWMSQSFKGVDRKLLDGTHIVARGKRSAKMITDLGLDAEIGGDLSFLIEPKKWNGRSYKRAFCTHGQKKNFSKMFDLCDAGDVQVIWKPEGKKVFEAELPIEKFCGSVEENFGIIDSVDEVHTARYHAGCACILSGKIPIFYATDDIIYNEKYLDLMDNCGLSKKQLRDYAMISCRVACDVIT